MTLKYLSDEHILVKISLFKILHLWVPLSLSIYALIFLPPPKIEVFLLNTAIVYLTVCLGHCVGLHRYIIHQSFKMSFNATPFFLLISSLSGIGGPKTWIKVHALRDHWQNQIEAPKALKYDNSMAHDFFINLHCSIYPKENKHLKRLPEGVASDPWVNLFEFIWVPLNILIFTAVWYLWSLDLAIWLVAIRVTLSVVGHWLVGYIVHKWGYKSYGIKDVSEEGRNSLILGWLTFGEAYHNNHHKFPDSASMGLKPKELDLGYCTIILLKIIGLAKEIKVSEDHFSKRKT